MSEIPDILRRIVEQRQIRVHHILKAGGLAAVSGPASDRRVSDSPSFLDALTSSQGHAVIAEVKMGSPRLGSLQGSLDPVSQARLYADNGAVALSVVVEPDYFHGSYDLLKLCQQASGLPALAKDFVVHPVQLEWAVSSGAQAVLLIAALYPAEELLELANRARELGLVALVECHSDGDVVKLGRQPWDLVGVNNRDLRTFEVDLAHSESMLPRLPAGALKVAESGIGSSAEIGRLAAAGFDAFLVGETLLLADDPGATLRDLVEIEDRP